MRLFIRRFFKILRLILGPFMLLWELLTRPQGLTRATAMQEAVNARCKTMVLYQYRTCPFCIKVRREIHRLSLPIALRDAQQNLEHRAALQAGGGKVKVPCLVITDEQGATEWMYESGRIMAYLHAEFGQAA